MRVLRALAGSMLPMMVISCGGAQPGGSGALPCDEVELVSRSPRPEILSSQIRSIEDDWRSAPSPPSAQIGVRLARPEEGEALATELRASLSAQAEWSLLVFPSVERAKAALPQVLCDPRVADAELFLR